MSSSKRNTVVAVTGASGYIATNVVAALIQKSDANVVRGTVRSLSNKEKVQHLTSQFPPGKLTLFEADLLIEGSFDACFSGVDYVIHTASPFKLQVEDPQRDLIVPALKGTENVLRSALKAGVKKVILTSSCAAVSAPTAPDVVKEWTEADWNSFNTLEKGPYRMSKYLAERFAWDFIETKAKGVMELAVINPALVTGPPLSNRTDGQSVTFIRSILNGDYKKSGGCPSVILGTVDVRDVAQAHVEAMVRPEASGKRFILSSVKPYSLLQYATAMKANDEIARKYGDNIPDNEISPVVSMQTYNHTRAEEVLGIEFTDILGKSIVDMALALDRMNMIN
eukprot:TRINITY_DN6335_c0_g1_i1.p1 TRINITY_DN6335_c0_g1~~TRINITY_DN6335_c0_g1_i1.p1  ORF type:complete len:361 (+),score=50.37 TRINITY_DN6335_c0_g1_i1:71-1084(+)